MFHSLMISPPPLYPPPHPQFRRHQAVPVESAKHLRLVCKMLQVASTFEYRNNRLTFGMTVRTSHITAQVIIRGMHRRRIPTVSRLTPPLELTVVALCQQLRIGCKVSSDVLRPMSPIIRCLPCPSYPRWRYCSY